ncbi:LytTR family DNA-binding domain-containing protein [Profundibacter sp.]|uniref:LytTR family DNA-binding domain-containing protein n=1 Tax=Profundibacter sp. TaxID=3101071 RepID=UPI003D0A1DE4
MNNTFKASVFRVLNFWHWREQLIALGLTILAFAYLGPFSTSDMSFGTRLLYWGLDIGIGWILVLAFLTLFVRNPAMDEWPSFIRIGLAVLAATLPISYTVVQIEWLIRGNGLGPQIVVRVFFVCALIGGIISLRIQSRLGVATPAPQTPAQDFFKRLPFELGTDLISLSMQDHYVEATTTKGSALILMRLSDAISELPDASGVQIHRSHWAAINAMRRTKRDNGKLLLELSDGRSLPVSRTYAATVKAVLNT